MFLGTEILRQATEKTEKTNSNKWVFANLQIQVQIRMLWRKVIAMAQNWYKNWSKDLLY